MVKVFIALHDQLSVDSVTALITPDVEVIKSPDIANVILWDSKTRLKTDKPVLVLVRNGPMLTFALSASQDIRGVINIVSADKDVVVHALRVVGEGHYYIHPDLAWYFIKRIRYGGLKHTNQLTKREIDVLHLMCDGLTANRIGKMLGISHRTVENYLYTMRSKLGIKNRSELIDYARDQFGEL